MDDFADIEQEVLEIIDEISSEDNTSEDPAPLNKLCQVLEQQEMLYLDTTADPFEDHRNDFPIGRLLGLVHDDFLEAIFTRCIFSSNETFSTAALRTIIATAPVIHPVHFSQLEHIPTDVIQWVKTSNLPKRAFATGALGVLLTEGHISSQAVKGDLATVLLQRLEERLRELGSRATGGAASPLLFPTAATSPLSPAAATAAPMEPTPEQIKNLELRYIVLCLSEITDYQEVLAPFIQTGGLDMVMTLLRTRDKILLAVTLKLVCAMLAHKRLGLMFVDRGGVQALLALPREAQLIEGGVGLSFVGLGSLSSVMEKIVQQLPADTLRQMVEVGCAQMRSHLNEFKKNGTLFFHASLMFKPVLAAFDAADGMRLLLNLLRSSTSQPPSDIGAEEKQVMHCTCLALRSYLRAHLVALTSESILKKKSHKPKPRAETQPLDIENKPIGALLETLEKNKHAATVLLSRPRWRAASHFVECQGPELILAVVKASLPWKTAAYVPHAALEVLHVLTAASFSHLPVADATLESGVTGMGVLLEAIAGTTTTREANVTLTALSVVCNMVCSSSGGSAGASSASASAADAFGSVHARLCDAVRTSDGIKVLLNVLRSQQLPNTEADSIRALTCKALVGLSRNSTVRQMLSQLQIGRVLTELIKDIPSTSGQTSAAGTNPNAAKFRQYALQLISVTTAHLPVSLEAADPTLRRLERAAVVDRTPVSFQQSELLALIHKHLAAKGLSKAAAALAEEANLPLPSISDLPSSSSPTSTHSHRAITSSTSVASTPTIPSISFVTPLKPVLSHHHHHHHHHERPPTFPQLTTPRPSSPAPPVTISHAPPSTNKLFPTPIRLSKPSTQLTVPPSSTHPTVSPIMTAPPSSFAPTPAPHGHGGSGSGIVPTSALIPPTPGPQQHQHIHHALFPPPQSVSLDYIVTQFLKQQHRFCSDPICVLPPFPLSQPHQCPAPSHFAQASTNVTNRILRAQTEPPAGGMFGRRWDRRLIYSRFRQSRIFRDEEATLMSTAFSANGEKVYCGSGDGVLHAFNVWDPDTTESFEISSAEEDSTIYGLRTASRHPALLAWFANECKMYNSSNLLAPASFTLPNCHSALLSHNEDMIVATSLRSTHLFDSRTGKLLTTLEDSTQLTDFNANIACFSMDDTLVLSDGVLWDPRASPRILHKFDKLSNFGTGVFHPSGNEIIINSEVWDFRTRKLLRTVPALDQTYPAFSPLGDIIYAVVRQEDESSRHSSRRPFNFTSFRTIDSHDYEVIATVDHQREIMDIAIDPTNNFVALVENEGVGDLSSSCRLYEIGRQRPQDGDQDVDESDEEGSEGEGEQEEGSSDGSHSMFGDDFMFGSDMSEQEDFDVILGDESEGEQDNAPPAPAPAAGNANNNAEGVAQPPAQANNNAEEEEPSGSEGDLSLGEAISLGDMDEETMLALMEQLGSEEDDEEDFDASMLGDDSEDDEN